MAAGGGGGAGAVGATWHQQALKLAVLEAQAKSNSISWVVIKLRWWRRWWKSWGNRWHRGFERWR
jgi:hypothetical protein